MTPIVRRGSLDAVFLTMVGDLSNAHGQSWASEAGFVAEFARRTGRRVGARSFYRVRDRLEARGLIGHTRVLPGQRMANGVVTSFGTAHHWIVTRQERRRARKHAKASKSRQKRGERQNAETAAAVQAKRAAEAAQYAAAEAKLRREAATPAQIAEHKAKLAALWRDGQKRAADERHADAERKADEQRKREDAAAKLRALQEEWKKKPPD